MISSKCVNGIIVMIFQEFEIYRLNTFAATHAWSWVSRKMKIQVSHCLTDYFCWNIAWEFVTIWISHQVSPGSYISNNTSNDLWITWWICVWILLPLLPGYSYNPPPLRFACYPYQHTLRTGDTNDHQSVSFCSRFCNGAVDFNDIWHRLSSLVRWKVSLISRWSIKYFYVRSTV